MASNSGNQIASAYVSIAPNAKGFKEKLDSELAPIKPSIKVVAKELKGQGLGAIIQEYDRRLQAYHSEIKIRARWDKASLAGMNSEAAASGGLAGARYATAFERATAGIKGVMAGAIGTAGKFMLGVGLVESIRKITEAGMEQGKAIQNARLGLEGYGASAQQASQLLEGARKGIEGTHAAMKDIADNVVGAFGAGIHDAREMERYTRLVANAASMYHNDFKGVGQIFDKMRDKQIVHTGDINQLAARNLAVMPWLEKAWNVSGTEVRKRLSKGVDFAKDIQPVLEKNLGSMAEVASHTLESQAVMLKKNMADLGTTLFTPVVNGATAALEKLNPIFGRINTSISNFIHTEGFSNFINSIKSIGTELGKLLGIIPQLARAAAPLIGFIGSSVWTTFRTVVSGAAVALRQIGTMIQHTGTGFRIAAAAITGFILRERLLAATSRIAAFAVRMLGMSMKAIPGMKIATTILAAGAAFLTFASKSKYAEAAGHAVSGALDKMCGWMGIQVPQGASISEKAMAALGKAFDTACSFIEMVVKTMANEVEVAFSHVVNAALHAYNALKHVYNGIARIANVIPGVHLGTMNMTETKDWGDQDTSGYAHREREAYDRRNAEYNQRANEDLRRQVAERKQLNDEANGIAPGGGGGFGGGGGDNYASTPGLSPTGSGGAGSSSGSSGSGRSRGGGRGGRSPVDQLAQAHANVQRLVERTSKLMLQEQEFEKTHNGMKNPKLMQQLVQALNELKKALALESQLKKQGNTHAEKIEAQSKQKAGTAGKGDSKGQQMGQELTDEAKNLGKEAISDQFDGTPFSNPLEWKNVKSLEALLNGMGNGMSNMFHSLGNPMGGPKGGSGGTGGGLGAGFHGTTGKAGAQLSTKQATQSSAAKSFAIKSGTPQQAPGSNDPFLQFGGSSGGSGQGLLSGLKDATNLKNFISKDAMERFQNPGGGPKDKGNDIAGQPKNGQTVNYNIHGANSHEVAQKVNRQHTVNRAKVHSGRH